MNRSSGIASPSAAPVLQREVVHREVDAVQLATGHRQVARLLGAAGKQDGVEVPPQLVRRHVHADVHAGPEDHTLVLHEREAPVENPLLHLELGDSVAQEAPDPVGLLEHRHRVSGAIELVGGGQASRARSDDRDLLPRPGGGRLRSNPPFVVRTVDDRDLDRLDRDRVVVDAKHAGAFARRRAQPPGELGEVVRGLEALERRTPPIAVDQVVPVRDQVSERAALVAERDAAVHAAGALHLQIRLDGSYGSR
jgi:hypothetical protein